MQDRIYEPCVRSGAPYHNDGQSGLLLEMAPLPAPGLIVLLSLEVSALSLECDWLLAVLRMEAPDASEKFYAETVGWPQHAA